MPLEYSDEITWTNVLTISVVGGLVFGGFLFVVGVGAKYDFHY